MSNGSKPCCTDCLGLSTTEYSLLLALPSLLAVPLTLFIGHIIDFLGLPYSVLLLTGITSVGASIRAMSAYNVELHSLSVALLIIGDALVGCGTNGSVAVREYIAIRFFPSTKRPLILGLTTTLDFVVLGLTALIVPPITAKYGVWMALWVLFSSSLGVAVASVGIAAVYHLSYEMKNLENEMSRNEESIHGFSTFPVDFWIIVLACGCFFGAHFTVMSNMQLIQTTTNNITTIGASQNVAWGFMSVAVSLIVSGIVLSVLPIHILVALYGSVASVLGCIQVEFRAGLPIISNLLIGSGYGTTYVSLKALYGHLVHPENLGRAATVVLAARLLAITVLSLVTGILMHKKRAEDTLRAMILFIFVFLASAVTVGFLLLKERCHSEEKEEKKALMDTKEEK